MKNSPKPLVLDTNILMFAISSSTKEGPDNNSDLDRSTRNRDIEPDKIRGALIQQLLTRQVIVPKVALDELNSKKTTAMLSPTNMRNRQLLNDVVEHKAREHTPSRLDIQQQYMAISLVKARAKAKAKEVKEKGGLVPDHWDLQRGELSQDEKSQRMDPELFKDPYCTLHRKLIKDHTRATASWKAMLMANETPEIDLLEKANQNRKLVLERGISPAEIRRLTQEIAELEMEAEKIRSYLAPDFEIRAIAVKAKAALLSYDNDFKMLNLVLKATPVELEPRRQALPSTVKDLIAAFRENRKKFPDNPEIQ